ncbi:MAG TPA: hypothetical protein VFT74_12285 [Isosphaeraceae bacterium]|nr:hypothetical protein [Isosphaeraceae bacterium]
MSYSVASILENGSVSWRISREHHWVGRTYQRLHFDCAHSHLDTRERQKAARLLSRMSKESWVVTRTPDQGGHSIHVTIDGDVYVLKLESDNRRIHFIREPGVKLDIQSSVSDGAIRA